MNKQPIPEAGETKKQYIERAMRSAYMIRMYFDAEFRKGICLDIWNTTSGKNRHGSRFGPLESKIESDVRDYAKTLGKRGKNSQGEDILGIYSRKYTSPSFRSVPDTIFIFSYRILFGIDKPPRDVFIEFKSHGKEPSPSQWREINKLSGLGCKVYVIDNTDAGKCLIDSIVENMRYDK